MEGAEYQDTLLELKRREVDALERNATANEKLIELATAERIEFEQTVDPPHCPYCHALNPRIGNAGGEGKFNEFALIATCGECGKQFIAVPTGWRIAKTREDAIEMMKGGSA